MTRLDLTIMQVEDRIGFYKIALRNLKTLRQVRKIRSDPNGTNKGMTVSDLAEKIANQRGNL